MMPTDEEVLQSLNENATKLDNGNWTFGNPLYSYSEQSAKNIVRICLTFDIPVWVVALEDRITSLEEL